MPQALKDLSFLELFVINTIIYFDIFDFPLTQSEIYRNLYTGGMDVPGISLDEIDRVLTESEKLKKIIAKRDGFYFFKGREEIIRTRLERYNLASQKFKIALRAIRILKFLPFVNMIAICNNLSYQNARAESDIDFFIITAKNRLYFTRFFVTAVVALLGIRRHGLKITNRICLSFYTTEENMDFSKIKIASEDVYLANWLTTLWPCYVRNDFYDKFMNENSWLKKYLPNFEPIKIGYRYRVDDNSFNKFIYSVREFIFGGFFGNSLESCTKKIQLERMAQKKKDLAVVGDNKVIISDTMLKFHENDRRFQYLQEFERKRSDIINKL